MFNGNVGNLFPCIQCNMTITNFPVSQTCKVRFHDVIDQSTNDVKANILKHGQRSILWRLFFIYLFNSLDLVL